MRQVKKKKTGSGPGSPPPPPPPEEPKFNGDVRVAVGHVSMVEEEACNSKKVEGTMMLPQLTADGCRIEGKDLPVPDLSSESPAACAVVKV